MHLIHEVGAPGHLVNGIRSPRELHAQGTSRNNFAGDLANRGNIFINSMASLGLRPSFDNPVVLTPSFCYPHKTVCE